MTTVYTLIPSPPLIVRRPQPIPLASAEAPPPKPPRVTFYMPPVPDRLDPRDGATDVPLSKIWDDPIIQLDSTRNGRTRRAHGPIEPGYDNPWKRGDYQRAGAMIPIQRESSSSRQQRGEALRGTFARAHLDASPKVALGQSGSGFDYYRGPRIKPALPFRVPEVVARTRGKRDSPFIQSIINQSPVYTPGLLASEGTARDAIGYSGPEPEGIMDGVTLGPGMVVRASERHDDEQSRPGLGVLMVVGIALLFVLK